MSNVADRDGHPATQVSVARDPQDRDSARTAGLPDHVAHHLLDATAHQAKLDGVAACLCDLQDGLASHVWVTHVNHVDHFVIGSKSELLPGFRPHKSVAGTESVAVLKVGDGRPRLGTELAIDAKVAAGLVQQDLDEHNARTSITHANLDHDRPRSDKS